MLKRSIIFRKFALSSTLKKMHLHTNLTQSKVCNAMIFSSKFSKFFHKCIALRPNPLKKPNISYADSKGGDFYPLVVDTSLSMTPNLSMAPFSSYTHILHQKPGLVVDTSFLVDNVFALSTTRGGGRGNLFPGLLSSSPKGRLLYLGPTGDAVAYFEALGLEKPRDKDGQDCTFCSLLICWQGCP